MKSASPDVDFPALERQLLEEWEAEGTFQASLHQREGAKEFTFYDGPPFANGLPHYGHLLANTIKDIVPRYWTMRGYYVDRRFGWDCHGVPVEYEIEKRENLKGRADILAMGVAKFNEECRKSVLHYTEEWKKTITRLGRWVDWNNQYRTMDKDFMESVWWVLSELYNRGLVYRDFKVVPYSPRITAVLSNFEANQNYKEVQDPAITVKFKLADEDAYLLAWTTTPWTLISNLALCVGPEIPYVKIRDAASGEVWYLAEELVDSLYKKGKKKADSSAFGVLERVSAKDLVGRTYEPLFPYFRDHDNAFQVLQDDYVTTEEGTGIVHQAPAYGEDDFRICRENGISLVDPVDEDGVFTDEVPEFKDLFVKDADKGIIKRLKDEGSLVKQDTLVHSYPFCERTDTPLIYKAITTWYVKVTEFKDQLVDNNSQINWVPDHLREGRMGKWLENARDWAISRNRFWGTPIPIWLCENNSQHVHVISSVAELEEKTGETVTDLHSHYIDHLTFPCESCGAQMQRIPEVFDCWFESGSMPYAQIHYPLENRDRFQERFPADFIAEGLDQTRGWFYTLSVLSTALFQSPAFKNVVVNGMVLAADGKKMSKRLQNYTPPADLLEKFGSDSVRLYMINSPVLKAGDLCFTDQGVKDTTRAVLLPLWNAYSFLTTYAEADGWRPSEQLARGEPPAVTGELDRWIISRFQTLCDRVREQMELYRLYAVVPPVLDFIEELTNWYIRLSRKRFWGTDAGGGAGGGISSDADAAYRTLYYVLTGFVRVFAPFAPFVSDRIYKNLVDGFNDLPASVHLCDTPLANRELEDPELERRMALVRRATNLGRSLRSKHNIKTRQALPSMLVITRHEADRAAIEGGADMIRGELNVKEIHFTTDEAAYVRLGLKPNLKTLGKRLGKQVNEMKQHLAKLNENPEDVSALLGRLEDEGSVEILGHTLSEDDFLIDRGPKDERLIATEGGVTVLLDTRLTDELVAEGLAREVVNRIQKLRKDSGLAVTDRINLEVEAEGSLGEAVSTHRDYIAKETLARTLTVDASGSQTHTQQYDIDGMACRIGLSVTGE